MTYRAPLKEMFFVLDTLAGLEAINRLPGFEEASRETAYSVLEEAAKFSEQVVAPLNRVGDLEPSRWQEEEVITTPGFKPAFQQFAQGGWQGIQHSQQFGGQGLPKLIATACHEMLHSANLSFALCPMLTDGAIEALLTAGSDAQKATFLPKLISGEWTGTMNLTEPQAGSDLAAVRTR
ncbi:acyl-CoA dehydrogenase family protein, partial [Cupriavidus necator]